jgi:hypothetical protein
LIAAIAPGYYAQEWDPPERAQFVAAWVVSITLTVFGYGMGYAASDATRGLGMPNHERLARAAWCAVHLMAAAAPLPAIRDTLARVPADVAYAAEWDHLDATIRVVAGSGEPIVLEDTLPAHYGFEFLGSDPGLYPNPCVARFYGVPSITVTQTE